MNNRGQSLGIGIISAIFIFIVGIMFINFLMPEVTEARNNLACSDSANISDGTKLLCLVIDTVVVYWILLIVSIAIGFIIVRIYR